MSETKIMGLGLWGGNGHQIHNQLKNYPQLNLRAFGAFNLEVTAQLRENYPQAVECSTYEELLAVQGLKLVSLCSPLRSEQAVLAITALEAGIHVYAEKPCATNEADLDKILSAAEKSSASFHEMAGTVCEQPYWAMRKIVADGTIGEIVQVSAQKSYPFGEWRPVCEDIDGGMLAQNGVHALRFIEQISGLNTVSIDAIQTHLGDERPDSDLKMASSMMGKLENGGVFSVVANYLNPTGFGSWGNEMLRVFGTKGMLESVDGGTRTRLVVGDKDHGQIDTSDEAPDWLNCVIANAADGQSMPFDLETELHPTRMVLKAKVAAEILRK